MDQREVVVGGVALMTVTFSPTDLGARSGKLVVRPAFEKLTPIEIDLTGEGVTTTLTVDPQMLSFGNVVLGTSKKLEVTLTNTSQVEASIGYSELDNVKLCTAGGSDQTTFCFASREYPLGSDARFTLPGGQTTRLEVEFEPTVAGARERGSFVLTSCPLPACRIEVRLDGVGIESGFRCTPPNIDFGFINPGSCTTNTVSCENIANEQVTVISWQLADRGGIPSSPDFTLEAPAPVTLAEGDTVEIDVTYCPTNLGNDEGDLEIETNNPDPRLGSWFVGLEGSGGGPDVDVVPRSLNYGLVSLIAPARRTVTIQNVGYDVLLVTDINPDSSGTGSFTIVGPTTFQIEPQGFADVTVEFQPVMPGVINTDLIVYSNDQDEPEFRISLEGEGINLPPCRFEVVPAQLSFGVVQTTRNLGRSFEIRNTGTNDCLVTSARLVPGVTAAEFSLPEGDVMSLIIPPASSTTIRVLFSPNVAGDFLGAVEFSISSPQNPFNEVPLSGTGAESVLLVVPNDLDFGVVGVNCSARARTVNIFNTGANAAEISNITFSAPASPAFQLTNTPDFPVNLPPGGTTSFDIGFHANAIASYAGAIEITATFNSQPVTYLVTMVGAGAVDAAQVDEFEQLGKPKVDMLWIVDNSCSMFEEQASLGSNFAAFIEFAEAQQIDYQIAVTTTDVDVGFGGAQGRFVPTDGSRPRIVTPQTQPSPQQIFVANTNLGTTGSGFEQGLEAAYLALSNPLINTDNAGFLRQDAVLSLIFVSDEPDSSPETVDFYVNFFLSIKGFRNTNLFSASSIVGDTPAGCTGPGGVAYDGVRYIETAARTGGIFQSICTADWSRSLEELSQTAFGFKSRFFLSNQPIIQTVVVTVDGMMMPAQGAGGTINWTYDFATNSINFSPFATPEPGAEITVEYTVECL